MSFILIFDIPTELGRIKRQTNRLLARTSAKQVQRSVWKSRELGTLVNVATFIKKSGGDARILEEKFIF